MKLANLVKSAAVSGLLVLAYARLIRPGVLNWGATETEANASLPGDDILPAVALQTTRAISVDATPAQVWPWLVQMGPRPRAGVYTYDWLERLLGIDVENADRILPQFQHLEPGDFFSLNGKDNGLRVKQVLPERAIVLQWEPAQSTWAFVIEPGSDETTRLLSRNRVPGDGLLFRAAMAFMEPASLVMERKMLLGIKQRAELRAPGESGTTPDED